MSTANRLAKNTMYMYIRMFVLLIISLYTSRVLLQQLGVDDFGTYSLVGSILAMFSSLRGLFSSSIQRFLNYEMGRGNDDKLKLIFNTGIQVNTIIAIIFVILVEIVGIWFLNYKINISPDRLFAAKVVFQLSLISAIASIYTTSFDAEIIAHEHMDFYAKMSILEGIMKLAIVFILMSYVGDKLILYGIMMMIVSIIVLIINMLYSRNKFQECRFSYGWDVPYLKKILSFAGWQFFGNSAFTLTNNGLNMIINVFGGTVVNAARGIAFQIDGVVKRFLSNIDIVIRPYSIKAFGEKQHDKMFKLLFLSSKTMFIIEFCLILPFIMLTQEILMLWLGQVPDYTIIFIHLVLLNSLVRSLHSPLDILFKAVGHIKYYQITEGLVLSLPLLFSYAGLKMGLPIYSVFIFVVIFEVVNLLSISFLASRIAMLNLKRYFEDVLQPVILCTLCLFIGYYVKYHYILDNIVLSIVLIVFEALIAISIMYFIGFNIYEKEQINKLVRQYIKK